MKNFARVGSSAQTGQSHGAGNNGDKAVAAIPGCAIGLESGRLPCGPGRRCLGPHLENIHAMFDSENPGRAGGLAGDSYASVLENHPRYPSLRRARDAALLARLDFAVEQKIKCVGLLQQFGFDEAGIALYHAAALSAFRSALPI
jgi:hypothetical protein